MRRFIVLPVVLAVALATAAFAANQKGTVTFDQLGASGVVGDASLLAKQNGGTLIHGKLRGLEANVEYEAVIFQNESCAAGGTTSVIERFVAKNPGNGQFNKEVTEELSTIGSIAIRRVSDQVVVACGAVTEQL